MYYGCISFSLNRALWRCFSRTIARQLYSPGSDRPEETSACGGAGYACSSLISARRELELYLKRAVTVESASAFIDAKLNENWDGAGRMTLAKVRAIIHKAGP